MTSACTESLRVVIVGGGVGGLESALALRELAGDQVSVTLLTRHPDFVFRPLGVHEPFSTGAAFTYPIADIASDLGLELHIDEFRNLDAKAKVVHTRHAGELSYQALILAPGASRYVRFAHAVTLDDRRLEEQLHGLVQDVEGGYVDSVAFLLPERMPWPLPLYEIALMLAERANDMGIELTTTIVTPEHSPLGLFGAEASRAAAQRLRDHGIDVYTSTTASVPDRGRIRLAPGAGELRATRLIAMPELFGTRLAGVPSDAPGGFVCVDEYCRVRGLDDVWAVGDITNCPVKMGGIAAQQADVAAAGIAIRAGAPVAPRPLRPRIIAQLHGGGVPLTLSAWLIGGVGRDGRVVESPRHPRAEKLASRLLTPYLKAHVPQAAWS